MPIFTAIKLKREQILQIPEIENSFWGMNHILRVSKDQHSQPCPLTLPFIKGFHSQANVYSMFQIRWKGL